MGRVKGSEEVLETPGSVTDREPSTYSSYTQKYTYTSRHRNSFGLTNLF